MKAGRITPKRVEHAIYDWVVENFGKQEARAPSWYTPDLAKYVAKVLNEPDYKPIHRIEYYPF